MKTFWRLLGVRIAQIIVAALVLGTVFCVMSVAYLYVTQPTFYPGYESNNPLEWYDGAYTSVTNQLVNYLPLDEAIVREITDSRDDKAREMLARNPSLTREQRERFWNLKNRFVRNEVLLNMSLTREEIERALTREDLYAFSGFAMNPMVPEDILLRLYKGWGKKDKNWFYFAMNPNLPESILIDLMRRNHPECNKLLEERLALRRLAIERDSESLPGGGYYGAQIHIWWKRNPLANPGFGPPLDCS